MICMDIDYSLHLHAQKESASISLHVIYISLVYLQILHPSYHRISYMLPKGVMLLGQYTDTELMTLLTCAIRPQKTDAYTHECINY